VAGFLAGGLPIGHAQPGDEGETPTRPTPVPINEPPPAEPPGDTPPAPPTSTTEAPAPPEPIEPTQPNDVDHAFQVPTLQIHGFVGEGAFISTSNDYIGVSTRGSVELFEAGLNVSKEITDRLRAGIQFYARDEGSLKDLPPRLDWAFLDYHWKDWLGFRAGVIKMPFGLYNEYADIDSARTAILMPQSVYSIRNRSALLAQTGFSIYGERELGENAGSLEYQAWLGTLNIPGNALVVNNATLDNIDTKYVTGGQLFWHTPLDGLRIGGTFLRTSIDFYLTLDPATVAAIVMAGLAPADFTGAIEIYQRPDQQWIASAEYTHEDWLFAAEYSRVYGRQRSNVPSLLPTVETTSEHFYALATRRLFDWLEGGAYYSVLYPNVDDRHGHDKMRFPVKTNAWQRDAAVTLRFDVNDHWLWKLEAHVIDGTADVLGPQTGPLERYWALFLLKTTVTF
jgi:hypothetical protein